MFMTCSNLDYNVVESCKEAFELHQCFVNAFLTVTQVTCLSSDVHQLCLSTAAQPAIQFVLNVN